MVQLLSIILVGAILFMVYAIIRVTFHKEEMNVKGVYPSYSK